MPFLKFSRDKRGIEHFSLVHTTTNRRGKVRPRVLYWYRSPPDIKVGREPFDPVVRRALETQYPDITFDWRAIADTPIPSADADKWRERRRAERAAKHAAAAEESAEAEAAAVDDPIDVGEPAAPSVEVTASADAAPAATSSGAAIAGAPPSGHAARSGDPNRKRRRRRRNGGRGGAPQGGAPPSSPPGNGSSGD